MIEKSFTIKNKLGLHARAAALFVKVTHKCQADVKVECDGIEVEGKSIMGVMMLAAGLGSVIKVKADGPDAELVLRELETLIEDKFGEG